MSILVDTNILLRRIQPDHVHHAVAIDSVAGLLATGEAVYFTFGRRLTGADHCDGEDGGLW